MSTSVIHANLFKLRKLRASIAMVTIKLEHSNLAQHQSSSFRQLQTFRKEGKLCDVVLKSRDGTAEHRAHKAVLCAASVDLENMLVGPFEEAERVKEGHPIEMNTSDAAIFALLEYIYGDEPHIELEESLELLHLADQYNFPELVAAVEAGLLASLDSAPVATALKILQHPQQLHKLKTACEKKVAANFENCIDLVDFLELSNVQLGRILRRADLAVSREEVVVNGLFQWFHRSEEDRGVPLGLLLLHIDFQALSSDNLARLRHFAESMGSVGHGLQRGVDEALLVHKEKGVNSFWPKRHCLRYWSPGLGASTLPPTIVLRQCSYALCSHDGTLYSSVGSNQGGCVHRWKPGDVRSQLVAGRGAGVDGVNDLGPRSVVSVSEGKIFVADCGNRRLLSFENGYGSVVLYNVDIVSVCCSPSGAVYVVLQGGCSVEKVVDSTLYPLISNQDLPAELWFGASDVFVTKDEAVYILDRTNRRILRLKAGETQPVAMGEPPNQQHSDLYSLFVTEEEKIYVADYGQCKVWAAHSGDTAWTEVLACPEKLWDIIVEDKSLYVSRGAFPGADADVYEYLLPPELQLGRYRSHTGQEWTKKKHLQ